MAVSILVACWDGVLLLCNTVLYVSVEMFGPYNLFQNGLADTCGACHIFGMFGMQYVSLVHCLVCGEYRPCTHNIGRYVLIEILKSYRMFRFRLIGRFGMC